MKSHRLTQLLVCCVWKTQDSFYKVVLRAFSWYLLRRHY
jgi:hypothetical protein